MCGRGFYGHSFWNGVLLGHLDGISLGRVIGVNSERQMEIFWEMSNGIRLGDLEGDLVRNSEWV